MCADVRARAVPAWLASRFLFNVEFYRIVEG